MKQAKHYNLRLNSIFAGIVFTLLIAAGHFAVFAQAPASTVPQCSDGKDNDGDGLADWSGVKNADDTVKYRPDPACASLSDTNEFDEPSGVIIPCTDKCGLNDVFKLVNNVISFVITRLFFPFFIFMILFIGYKYLAAGGNSAKVAGVKKMIRNVVIGALLVLGAWLLVRTALNLIGYKESLVFFGK